MPYQFTTDAPKTCSRCREAKPQSDFGASKSMPDGMQTYCRICSRAITAAWRAANLEKTRALGREGKRKQREAEGEEVTRQKWNEWYANNAEHRRSYQAEQRDPVKSAAHSKAHVAVQGGVLVRPEVCGRCGVACKPDGHHHDYSKALEVEWLCRRCHRNQHEADKRERMLNPADNTIEAAAADARVLRLF